MTTTTQEIQTALANEARRSELRLRLATLRGSMAATASVVQRLSGLNSDAAVSLADAAAELAALEAGAGPGITAEFGAKSMITQYQEVEREAAKSACIDFIQANPECAEEDAAAAWDAGAVASSPLGIVTQSGLAMGRLYRFNLASQGGLPSDTWAAFRAWVVTTPKETIMGL